MVDIVSTPEGQNANNPSQNGGPGVQSGSLMGQPVAGTATPPTGEATAVDQNDPVAVAQAALDAAIAERDKFKAPEQKVDPKPGTTEHGQPKVENVPSQTEDGVVTYDPTGDAGLDFTLSFIGSLGIEGTDPAMVAAANGDFSFIEAKLAALGDKAKGWQQHIALGKQAFERQLAAFKADEAKTLTAVHTLVGGEKQWNDLLAWAGTVASKEEKEALNAMFDAGPIQAQMAARSLMAAYREAGGTTIAPAKAAKDASGVAPAAPKALTAADYYKEVDALSRKLGNAMDGSQEYTDLKRRYFGR